MARPLRIEYPGAWYHVMNRGLGRRAVDQSDDQRHYFLSLLGDISDRFGAEIHAYCLMGNHYHLMVQTREGNLQRIMRHINGVYTQYVNRGQRSDGPLFRGRYQAILVDADAYWTGLSRYIHRNPLEAGMVTHLAEYPWSSYPAYINQRKAHPWLHTRTILQALAPRRRAAAYRAFVEGGADDKDIRTLYTTERHAPILGDEDFKRRIVRRQKPRADEIPDTRRIHEAPDPDTIVAHVARAFGVGPDRITRPERRYRGGNIPRMSALYLCQTLGRMKLQAIAGYFGLGHYASVSRSIGQLRELINENKSVERKVLRLTKDLTP
jgi:REP element-mobilizing transposase RayT